MSRTRREERLARRYDNRMAALYLAMMLAALGILWWSLFYV